MQGRGSAREPKLAMAVKNLQTGGVPPVSPDEPILGRMLIPRHCFADMVAGGTGGMLLVDVMDLFDPGDRPLFAVRQGTNIVVGLGDYTPGVPLGEQRQRLIQSAEALGMTRAAAERIADGWSSGSTYYVSRVQGSWSQQDGWTGTFDLSRVLGLLSSEVTDGR